MQSRAGRLKAIKNQINPLIGYPSLDINFAAVNEILDPRITFSRSSNATVVGSNGLIQYAPHNLLTYSEQFDNAAWTKTNATVSVNVTTAPDGTTTADKLVENTVNAAHGVNIDVTASPTTKYTVSSYIKAGERTWARIALIDNLGIDGGRAWFDLVNGVVGNVDVQGAGSNITASIVAVGNGWYRCSVSGQMNNSKTTLTSQIRLARSNGDISYIGDGVSGIYIWGAQLNEGELQPYYTTTVKNLLGYSQNFENAAWAKSNSSIAASTVIGPFGFDGGEKLVENTVNILHYVAQTQSTSANSVLTLSIYAKAGERTQVDVRVGGVGWATSPVCVVNLITGAIVSGSGATVVPVGDGWFRISLTATADGTTQSRGIVVAPAVAGNSTYTGDGTSGIYIFGAQLSDSASLDTYSYNPVAAPTSTAYYGPRFDYDPVTLAPKGLLIEEQRTNLMLYSEDLSTVWNLGTGTVQSNTWTAPTGNLTGDIFTIGSDSTTPSQSTTITASATYTLSFFVNKPLTTAAFLRLRFGTAAGSISAFIDASTMSFGVVQAGIVANYIKQIQNNIYQVSVRFTYGATDGGSRSLAISGVVANNSSVPDTGKNIAIWGIQYELGAFPTSYIPTTSATVTRVADSASMEGSNFSSWYNQSEGTIYAAVSFTNTSSFNTVYSITDGTVSNAIRTIQWNNGTDRPSNITTAGVLQMNPVSTGLIGNAKYCVAFALNNANYAKNGILGVDDTSVTLPTVNQLAFGSTAGSTFYLNGWIQSFKYYPTRLPNGTLQGLTA
jgi:hypothetical protein